MSPEDGSDPVCCCPCDPQVAEPADPPDPGEVAEIKAEQKKTQQGKYGSQKVKPPESTEEKIEVTWIEIELVDSDDPPKPVPSARYMVVDADNRTVFGTLNEKGFARIEGMKPGTCTITFPEYDKDCWEPA